jgi:hypothetical protein
MTTDAY